MNRSDEIRARLEKATKGPWVKSKLGMTDESWFVNIGFRDEKGDVVLSQRQVARIMSLANGASDAAFIAHSRADIEYLLNLVEKAERMAEAVDAYRVEADGDFNGYDAMITAMRSFRAPAAGSGGKV